MFLKKNIVFFIKTRRHSVYAKQKSFFFAIVKLLVSGFVRFIILNANNHTVDMHKRCTLSTRLDGLTLTIG